MVSCFHNAARSAFFTVLTLRIAACIEVQEKRRARRKVSVRREWVELNTCHNIDFSLSLYKSSKLNTCSPFLSLFSRLMMLSIQSMLINLPKGIA